MVATSFGAVPLSWFMRFASQCKVDERNAMTKKREYRLAWVDDFSGPAGTAPNPSWWTHELGSHGWGNDEKQTYTDDAANAFQDGRGNLCITALKRGDTVTSARLITKGLVEFKYGRFECRLKLPKGAGLWSAVWLLGSNIDAVSWPACGEIDVMENVGAEPRRVFGTLHCPGFFKRDGISGDFISDSHFADDFHVFAVDWTASEIVWSIDSQDYFRVSSDQLGASWVFDHPFYILINLAVGGWLGGKIGMETEFPATFRIDYVKIFEAIEKHKPE